MSWLFGFGGGWSGGQYFFALGLNGSAIDLLLNHLLALDCLSLGFGKTSGELFHATGGVNQLLRAREKRVAGGADIDFDEGQRGPGLKLISAGAMRRCFLVFGVNS